MATMTNSNGFTVKASVVDAMIDDLLRQVCRLMAAVLLNDPAGMAECMARIADLSDRTRAEAEAEGGLRAIRTAALLEHVGYLRDFITILNENPDENFPGFRTRALALAERSRQRAEMDLRDGARDLQARFDAADRAARWETLADCWKQFARLPRFRQA